MRALSLVALVIALGSPPADAQTTAGIATTIVFPVAAQTVSFASEVTLFNPGPSLLTASVNFYEANNSGAPGPKVCNDVSVPAGRSAQITLSTQCALTGSGGHFGLVVVADKAVPQVNAFYGYTRVQNPQGIGFSVEGFPATNFNNQVGNATGLKRKAAAPTYQTNCFVGSLDQPVSYQLKLFNDSTGAQVGGTLAGSLAAFQQFRYLDVFGINGANAPAGDQLNVRAEFSQTSGGSANLIGFCTVQDNTSFGADFRIAKSYGSPSSSFFAQGGNAFGTMALLGTTDDQPISVLVSNQQTLRITPSLDAIHVSTFNVVNGSPVNGVDPAAIGATIGGGGAIENGVTRANHAAGRFGTIGGGLENSVASDAATVGGGLSNVSSNSGATIGGGFSNVASGYASFVGGGSANHAVGGGAGIGAGDSNQANGPDSYIGSGVGNTASGSASTIGGGAFNLASGDFSTIPGGISNTASASNSFAAGRRAKAITPGSFIWADSSDFDFQPSVSNFFGVRATGGVGFTVAINPVNGAVTQFCNLLPGTPSWQCTSDRDAKENFVPIDGKEALERVAAMPLSTWNFKGADPNSRALGPTAQDFYAAFHLGNDDKSIATSNLASAALAAIQGLHQVVLEKEADLSALEREVDSLKREASSLRERLARIESMNAEVAQLRAAVFALTQNAPRLLSTTTSQ